MTGRAARRLGHPVGLVAALSLLVLAAGCGGPLQEASVGGVASYDRGKQAFDKGDWEAAKAEAMLCPSPRVPPTTSTW